MRRPRYAATGRPRGCSRRPGAWGTDRTAPAARPPDQTAHTLCFGPGPAQGRYHGLKKDPHSRTPQQPLEPGGGFSLEGAASAGTEQWALARSAGNNARHGPRANSGPQSPA